MTSGGLSKFIVDERPLLVFRSLVSRLGLPEGVFLQQLHYWLYTKAQSPDRYADHHIDGRYWVHWTYEQMRAEIPFGTSTFDTHKRVVADLRALGILLVAHHGPAWDRTNWYSIDYQRLDPILNDKSGTPPSSGGGASNALGEAPPLPPRPRHQSVRANAAGHYLPHKTTAQTTTKDVAVDAGDVTGSGSPIDDQAGLELDGIPSHLHTEVLALLAGVLNAQEFVNLLAARFERDASLPSERQLGSPILWLREILRSTSKVDFSAARAFAARREAVKAKQRLAAERLARESEAERSRQLAQAELVEAAGRQIETMSTNERETLVLLANVGPMVRRAAFGLEEAVLAGRLPEHPLARIAVLNALNKTGSPVTPERRTT